jgi:hypothetical protein
MIKPIFPRDEMIKEFKKKKEKICSLHPIYQVEYDILFFNKNLLVGDRIVYIHTMKILEPRF